MRVYVAAPWVRREEARESAQRILAAGHTIVSRWLREHGDSTDPRVLAHEAQVDYEDVVDSDVLVLINLEKSEGKSVETGIAIGAGLPVIVVGERSNIFHYLDRGEFGMIVVPTLDEAIGILEGLRA